MIYPLLITILARQKEAGWDMHEIQTNKCLFVCSEGPSMADEERRRLRPNASGPEENDMRLCRHTSDHHTDIRPAFEFAKHARRHHMGFQSCSTLGC